MSNIAASKAWENAQEPAAANNADATAAAERSMQEQHTGNKEVADFNGGGGASSVPRRKPVAATAPLDSPKTPSRYKRPALWKRLSRRTLFLLAAAIIILLALILGLSIGLTRHRGPSDLPLPTSNGGPYTGDLTYYAPGLGACGVTSSSSDSVVSVSHLVFDAVSTGSNPNANPLCGKKIRARREGKSVDLTVVDRCTGCLADDLDTTVTVFGELADVALGRVRTQWAWLESVPAQAQGG